MENGEYTNLILNNKRRYLQKPFPTRLQIRTVRKSLDELATKN